MNFPRLYAIIDIDLLSARSLEIIPFAEKLRDAGVKLIQYRNKQGSVRTMLKDAEMLKNLRTGSDLKLILNDRADLAVLAGFDGVHVGQDDLSAKDARAIAGPGRWIGVSTHTAQQVIEANETSCDYIAYGPIFPTASKNNPDPIVGLDGLRMARALTRKPLVSIGGITRRNCRSVLEAGADSIAVISDLLPPINGSANTRKIAEKFLALLRD
jgi:thiamine-phosphate pyrophosphorylase